MILLKDFPQRNQIKGALINSSLFFLSFSARSFYISLARVFYKLPQRNQIKGALINSSLFLLSALREST
jgi:hypothetical protein